MRGLSFIALALVVCLGSMFADCSEAQARGGKGFLRGWGVRKLLPRNWPRNQQASGSGNAGCASCQSR